MARPNAETLTVQPTSDYSGLELVALWGFLLTNALFAIGLCCVRKVHAGLVRPCTQGRALSASALLIRRASQLSIL